MTNKNVCLKTKVGHPKLRRLLQLTSKKSSLILSESRLVNMLNTLKWLTWSDSKNNIIWLEAAK